eukprot:TRINITY_DN9595_c0_g1_i2.p2 TRINITY_DN9595_c0_g1~~TRINITY_DN9595_c0_g1_i2.p2  ORF type:complete len:342 (+),score=50.55 TRINITY_DN9595_c0_g1_i2:82-1107(+)
MAAAAPAPAVREKGRVVSIESQGKYGFIRRLDAGNRNADLFFVPLSQEYENEPCAIDDNVSFCRVPNPRRPDRPMAVQIRREAELPKLIIPPLVHAAQSARSSRRRSPSPEPSQGPAKRQRAASPDAADLGRYDGIIGSFCSVCNVRLPASTGFPVDEHVDGQNHRRQLAAKMRDRSAAAAEPPAAERAAERPREAAAHRGSDRHETDRAPVDARVASFAKENYLSRSLERRLSGMPPDIVAAVTRRPLSETEKALAETRKSLSTDVFIEQRIDRELRRRRDRGDASPRTAREHSPPRGPPDVVIQRSAQAPLLFSPCCGDPFVQGYAINFCMKCGKALPH